MKALAAAAVLALAGSAAHAQGVPVSIAGAWVVCGKEPALLQDSSPYGYANLKMWYAADGTTRWLWPDRAPGDGEGLATGRYTLEGSQLTATFGASRPIRYALSPAGESRLQAISTTGRTLYLCRLGTDEASFAALREPESLEFITDSHSPGRSSPPFRPGPAPRRGVEGVWEVVMVNAPQTVKRPPYGFLNWKLVVRRDSVCVATAREVTTTAGRCSRAKVTPTSIALIGGGQVAEVLAGSAWKLQRNRWGWLELHDQRTVIGARWLAPSSSVLPSLPPRVAILRLQH